MTLRALPRNPKHLFNFLYNVIYIRTVDGLMRKFVGQPWNDKNRERAFAIGNQFAERA
jgi:hypothetical protein